MTSEQFTLVCLEDLVPAEHQYRKFVKIFDFEMVESKLKKLERDDKYKGYGV